MLRRNFNESQYRLELDISPELQTVDAGYYKSLIGVLRWIVEMGRVDICCKVSMMSSFVAMPREGHQQQLYHLFAYLKKHHNARVVFDLTYPDIDYSKFEQQSWTKFYGEIAEELSPDMPETLGKEFIMQAFVDADHAGDTRTR